MKVSKTSKYQTYKMYQAQENTYDRAGAPKGTRSDSLTSIVAKHQKNGGGLFGDFFSKNLTMPKKTEMGGPFGVLQHPCCRQAS